MSCLGPFSRSANVCFGSQSGHPLSNSEPRSQEKPIDQPSGDRLNLSTPNSKLTPLSQTLHMEECSPNELSDIAPLGEMQEISK